MKTAIFLSVKFGAPFYNIHITYPSLSYWVRNITYPSLLYWVRNVTIGNPITSCYGLTPFPQETRLSDSDVLMCGPVETLPESSSTIKHLGGLEM